MERTDYEPSSYMILGLSSFTKLEKTETFSAEMGDTSKVKAKGRGDVEISTNELVNERKFFMPD